MSPKGKCCRFCIVFEGDKARLKQQDPNRPIIFVAHSLGGVLVKDVCHQHFVISGAYSWQAIHYSDLHREIRPNFATILDATRGIVFLGTPHKGSPVQLPGLGTFIMQIGQDTSVELIRDLARETQTLDRIRDEFMRILDRRTFTVFSFVEELVMVGGRKVCIAYMAMAQFD